MADFSFENDIAPLRGSHFSSGLSSSEALSLEGRYLEDSAPYRKESQAMLDNLERKRARDMMYERQKTMLEEAREEARRLREEEARLPEVASGLTNIIEDKNFSPFQKQEKLATYAMRYPRLVSGKTTGALFRAAELAVGSQIKAADHAQRKVDRELAALRSFIPAGNPELTAIMASKDGITPDEAQFIAASALVEQDAKAKSKKKLTLEAMEGAAKRAEKELEDGYKFLEGLKYEKSEDSIALGILGGTTAEQAERSLTKDSREALLTRMARYTGRSREELDKLPTQDLVDTATLYLKHKEALFNQATGGKPASKKPASSGFFR